MGAVVSRQTISATGQYRLVEAGTGYGQGGWQIAVVGSSWTGSGVLKQRTSPPGSAVTLGSAITYYLVNDGSSATAAITAAANVIVQDVGSDLYFDYTHTAGTVTITVMAAGELIGSEEGMLPVLNPVFAGTMTGPAVTVTGALTYGTKVVSTTALATPSALAATAFNAFASTVSGAVLMGYGTTGDVTLKNRAGTDVLTIGPNTTAAVFAGVLSVLGASLTVSTAGAAFALAGTTKAGADQASGALTVKGNIGTGTGAVGGIIFQVPVTHGSDSVAQTLTTVLTLSATTTVAATFAGPLAITGALTGVTELLAVGTIGARTGNQLRAYNSTNSTYIALYHNDTLGVLNGNMQVDGALAITGALTGVTTLAASGTSSLYGGTVVPATAGAAAAGTPIVLYSGLLTIEATSDAPTHTRPKGSLCINTGGSSTTTRLYVNTDGAGTWTPFTTSA